MKEEIVKRILESARRQAAGKNYRLDIRTANELELFIRKGVNRLSNTQLRSEITIQEAQNNIADLVDLMTENALSRRLTESLDISALNNSLKGFCPRFPFC